MPDLFGRASSVAADHAHLRATWTRLHELCNGGFQAAPLADSWQLIEAFTNELRAHFAAEEADGYFGALVEERPQLRSHIERLRAEHQQILALVAQLISAGADALAAGKLESGVRELLDRFNQHERAEARLLQDFFGRDEGGEGS